MKIENDFGHRIELRLVGYQFPRSTGEDSDDNWLVVEGHVTNSDGEWSFREPCLTTHDAADLAEWMSALADRKLSSGNELDFMEPNVSFEARTQSSMRVFFELEARPPWAEWRGAGAPDVFLDFEPSPELLRTAAAELLADLDGFPPRGGWTKRTQWRGTLHEVTALREGQSQSATLIVQESESEVSIAITLAGGLLEAGTGLNIWDALVALRRKLDPRQIRLGVVGALPSVWPSGMSAQMSGGRKAYRQELGKQPVVVDVLSPTDPGGAVSLDEQRKWQEAFRRESHQRAGAPPDFQNAD